MIILNKSKIITYITIFILVISLVLNFSIMKENNRFKSQIGAKYLTTVRLTIFELDGNTAEYWGNELKKKNGDIRLERFIGKLRVLSEQYHRMNGKLSIIGTQIDYCISGLYELKDNTHKHQNTKIIQSTITKNILFITDVLSEVKKNLGENERLWYDEFSASDTKTAKIIWKKFKDFNNQKADLK